MDVGEVPNLVVIWNKWHIFKQIFLHILILVCLISFFYVHV